MKEEGLYRISGATSEIKKLRKAFEKGIFHLPRWTDILCCRLYVLKEVYSNVKMLLSTIKRNANAFSLNAIADVRRLRCRHEMIFLISRKLLKLAASISHRQSLHFHWK